MSKALKVYLNRYLVGHLIQDDHGDMVFEYEPSWLTKSSAIPLSYSLPLRKERFSRKECQGFFAGLLPEENKRKIIAENLGISVRNDYSMLERIGGECAGAVTFIPSGEVLPARKYQHYQPLDDGKLAEILRKLPRQPLMAGEEGIRLSLAGAQDKIAVYINTHLHGSTISLPFGGASSTHILKPANAHFEGVVFNEAFCMMLAKKIGLPVANTEIRCIADMDCLLVERYDRRTVQVPPNGGYYTSRLHQEDFCQALGIIPERKYQSEGGPSLKQCFALVREVSDSPVEDLRRLLDTVIFNVLIGNHDAHGKNFSLLYDSQSTVLGGGGAVRLAPLYDLVSTIYYPELHKNMAMKIGGEYLSDKLYPKHFEKLAEETGLTKSMTVGHVPELAELVMSKLDTVIIEHPIAQELSNLIRKRCELFIRRFA